MWRPLWLLLQALDEPAASATGTATASTVMPVSSSESTTQPVVLCPEEDKAAFHRVRVCVRLRVHVAHIHIRKCSVLILCYVLLPIRLQKRSSKRKRRLAHKQARQRVQQAWFYQLEPNRRHKEVEETCVDDGDDGGGDDDTPPEGGDEADAKSKRMVVTRVLSLSPDMLVGGHQTRVFLRDLCVKFSRATIEGSRKLASYMLYELEHNDGAFLDLWYCDNLCNWAFSEVNESARAAVPAGDIGTNVNLVSQRYEL